jgi:uncharacterized OB-fold protein
MVRTRPIAAGLFTDDTNPHLIGGKHRDSWRIVFPRPSGQEGRLYDEIALSPTGTVWSWTVQRFRPKSPPYVGPEAFEPFALGYVELPAQTIVQARLTGLEPAAWRVGMQVRLVVLPVAHDADGTTVLSYAFAPAIRQEQGAAL